MIFVFFFFCQLVFLDGTKVTVDTTESAHIKTCQVNYMYLESRGVGWGVHVYMCVCVCGGGVLL